MLTQRELFLKHNAQTSSAPLLLEFVKAKGIYLFDKKGKRYIDAIAGIGVSNIGHCHPNVVRAVQRQAKMYMHLMVYGEYIQSPQTQFAQLLCQNLPSKLNSVYFVNSGSEATEGALKLAKRATGRKKIVAFKNSYHGSTQGALSVMGNDYFKKSYQPLLPDIHFLNFNDLEDLKHINDQAACVILEPVQGEAGVICAQKDYLRALRKKCDENGVLLILDEIQTGFGRTGKLFAFENYELIPDILLLAKGMGGGMPIGAFVAHRDLMITLSENPVLGHITTFGGHPVCCAAGMATLQTLLSEKWINQVEEKANYLKSLLIHPNIKEIRHQGLMMAIQFANYAQNKKIIDRCIENGVITDWFLHRSDALRLAPPLIITKKELRKMAKVILKAIDETK